VAEELAGIGGRLVIVDNQSGDSSVESLSGFIATHPRRGLMTLVRSPDNRGFAAGNNQGFNAVRADYYLLLNSDAEAEPGALASLIAAARANPKAGIVTPRLVDGAGRTQCSRFRRHSPLSEFVDGAQTGPITRLFRRGEVAIGADDWSTPPDWVSFAAVMISAPAIAAAGSMDEGYFLYFEDCDYCLAIRRAAFEIAAAPAAVFRHDAGGSTNIRERTEKGVRLPAYYYRARSRYFRRHYGPLGPMLANLCWYAGRTIALARAVIGRPAPKVPSARARDIWIGWRTS
jgi:GT2 family glycosyltransferase